MLLGSASVHADFWDSFDDFIDSGGRAVTLWQKAYCVDHDCSNGVPNAPKQFKRDYKQNPEQFFNQLQNQNINFNSYRVLGNKCYTGVYNFCQLPGYGDWGSSCYCGSAYGPINGLVGN